MYKPLPDFIDIQDSEIDGKGLFAKQIIKEDKNLESSKIENIQNVEVINQITELKDLHDKGILNEDEFKKAKEKILK